jgi:hypothetical protein
MSLPRHFGTSLETIPAAIPYLRAQPERVRDFKNALPKKVFKIGIAWKGNRNFENDADRSIFSLDVLGPLGQVPNIAFINLQKDVGETEISNLSAIFPLTDLSRELNDFADTAALIANLDLVISVDTAVAHLAGSINVPCWILLPHYRTDWRWMTNRTDSPWYPNTVRLFRQAHAGDWATVIEEVKTALLHHIGSRS